MTPLWSTMWARARADITTRARLKEKKPKERVNQRKHRRTQEEPLHVNAVGKTTPQLTNALQEGRSTITGLD